MRPNVPLIKGAGAGAGAGGTMGYPPPDFAQSSA